MVTLNEEGCLWTVFVFRRRRAATLEADVAG